MTDNSIHHLQHVSQKYLVLFNVLLIVIPIADFLYWGFFNHLPEGFLADLPVMPVQKLSSFQLILGAFVSLLPAGVILYGLATLKGLFRLYAKAITFSTENVKYFHRLGYVFIAWVMASVIFTPLISLVITHANSVGEKAISFNLELPI